MTWKFNNDIAKVFNKHARQHIPDYDRVIDLSVDLCEQKLKKDSNILEIGCAIGQTIKKLHKKGFKNIHAVDNSSEMLNRCPRNKAKYYCSSTFPTNDIKFNAVLCNWTLHFMNNKIEYLREIYNSLLPNSFMILSEKTESTGLALEQYYRYKTNKGVKEKEIKEKEKLLKDVMFIDSIEWYLKNLKSIGFEEVYIANANWCFTTFVAIKK